MTETILQLLTQLSEAGDDAVLSGAIAQSHYGPEFDRLLRKRVLVEVAPISEWDVCDRCECEMISRPIRQNGDRYQADCPLDPREDLVLRAEDIRSFRINLHGLAGEISTKAALRGYAEAVAGGLWKLGETEAGRLVFLIFQTSVLKLEGLLPIMRRLSGSGSVTLVAPRPPAERAAYLIDAGVHIIGFETVFAAHSASGDNAVLDPPSEEAELVVHVQSGAVEWRNCLISFPHQLFPSLRRLVDKALSRDALASKAYLEDTTGRAASDLVREMRDKIVASGFSQADAKDLIKTVHGRGYRLQIDPLRIRIIE